MKYSPDHLMERARESLPTKLTPALLLSLILGCSLLLASLTSYFVATQQQGRFEREVSVFDSALSRRLSSYINVLYSTRALWSTGADIDSASFGRYVSDLNLPERLPGVQSLSFARWLPATALSAFEADQRRAVPSYTVYTALGQRSGAQLLPITFLEPITPENKRALGFDMYSEAARHQAVDFAISTGGPRATAPVQLVQDFTGPSRPAVVLFMPVVRGNAVYGFVVMAVRVSDLMTTLRGDERNQNSNQSLGIVISDGPQVIYSTPSEHPVFDSTGQLSVAGRTWTLNYSASEAFGRDWAASMPALVLLLGSLVGLAGYFSGLAQVRAREQAEEVSRSLAVSRSSLERARAEFEAIFRSMHDTAVFTDMHGTVLFTNAALTRQFGYAPQELRGQSIATLHADGRVDRRSDLERVTTVYQRRDHSQFHGEMQRSVVASDGGEAIGYLEIIHDISERVAAERALKAGERRSQHVLDSLPTPLWVTDAQGEVTYRNTQYHVQFGERLLSGSLHPQDRAAYALAWQHASAHAEVMASEVRLLVGERYRYFMVFGAPIFDAPLTHSDDAASASGSWSVSEWVFTASDVHDRLQAERLAKRNEERYRGVLEGMPQIVWLTDAQGQPTYFNRRWHDYVGERGKGGFLPLLHPDDRQEYSARWQAALRGRELFEIEHRLLGADDVYHTFVTRGVAIIGGEGQLLEWVGTTTDIDDQVYAEWSSRLLAATSEQLSNVTAGETGAEGVTQSLAGLRAAMSLMNERFSSLSALWSRTAKGALSSRISQARGHVREGSLLTHPRVLAAAEQVQLSGETQIIEGEALHDSGLSALVLCLLTSPSHDAGHAGSEGELLVLGFRQQVRDRDMELTQELCTRLSAALERARLFGRIRDAQAALHELNTSLEERVAQRTLELKETNQELEAFSYSVSHDLRTPLRHIVGFSELLQKDASNNITSRSERYISIISEAAGRMSQLIDDLLEFSRMGRQELREGQVSLAALLQDVQRELQLAPPGQQTHFDIGPLPDVRGDSSLLRQVMLNLLGNAAKYSSRAEQSQVWVSAAQTGSEVVLTVRDNGVGFDDRYADKLFGVFQRLHRADEFEGSGIGLANVRRIITRHGGRVWAESEVGRGASFHVSLEAYTPQYAAPAQTPEDLP